MNLNERKNVTPRRLTFDASEIEAFACLREALVADKMAFRAYEAAAKALSPGSSQFQKLATDLSKAREALKQADRNVRELLLVSEV